MRAAGSLPFSDLADAGLAKIEKALPPDKVRDLRRFLDCLYVGQLSPLVDISDMSAMDPALLPAFETAFLQRRQLRFQYRDAKGAVTRRMVEPQAMLILPPLWLIISTQESIVLRAVIVHPSPALPLAALRATVILIPGEN